MKPFLFLLLTTSLEAASLRGTLRDENTRAPIERALIRLVSPDQPPVEARTGSDGRFVFEALPAARYTLQAVAEGFLPMAPVPLPLTADENRREYELRLAAELRITGRVLKAPDEPASAVTVEARQNGQAVATDWSDANGVFRLTGLAPGTYQIVAVRGITWEPIPRPNGQREAFALTALDQPVAVANGQPAPKVEIRLRRLPLHRLRIKLSGKVATLTALDAAPPLNPYDLVDRSIPANGCLVIDDLFPGRYNVSVDAAPPAPLTVPARPGC